MIKFKEIEISDRKWITSIMAKANITGCHQSFINLFIWSKIYDYQVAKINDFLLVKGDFIEEGPYYFYPIGQGDIKGVLEEIRKDAIDRGNKLIYNGVTNDDIDELNSLFPESFVYKEMRDSFDYVYLLEKMVNLPGKKLHAKRNYINRFTKKYEWKFEEITADNLSECMEMSIEWCRVRDCQKDTQLEQESCAVKRCFDYYEELGLEGGLLRVDGKVIAFTMGGKLSYNTYDINVEKAFTEFQGSYQMINREFATWIQKKYPEVVYLNREEDTGAEGLRQAKLSYYPDYLAEKYLAYSVHK